MKRSLPKSYTLEDAAKLIREWQQSEFWIDTNGCAESFHQLWRGEAGEPLIVKHADETVCEAAEFKFWPCEERK